ncbi:MAG TPA: single-stranded DNA-binding protein [Streptosporangiaceae bacterium]
MITVTVTGNLTDDPHTFQTRDNATGCELRVAVNLPSRIGTGDGITRYLKVVTFGVLAIHAAESVRKGDRVTIQGQDLTSEAWLGNGDGQPKSKVAIRATEIAVSLRYDNATTGRAARAAERAADPQAQADAAVLNGVTTTA